MRQSQCGASISSGIVVLVVSDGANYVAPRHRAIGRGQAHSRVTRVLSHRIRPSIVMPGLVPGIHVLASRKNVDDRDKPGHDENQSIEARASMRHQHRQLGMGHDVAGGAAEHHLPQPAAGEGALDQEVAAFGLGGGEHRLAGAAVVDFDPDRLRGDAVALQPMHSGFFLPISAVSQNINLELLRHRSKPDPCAIRRVGRQVIGPRKRGGWNVHR